MKKMIGVLIVLVLFACTGSETKKDPEAKWLPLFNGKDLEGWSVKIRGQDYNQDRDSIFRVQEGKLVVGYPPGYSFNDQFGHIFYKKPYSSYILAVEYRFVGEQASGGPDWAYKNSGIMIHCQAPETMGRDQDFPISLEVQLLGGYDTSERTTCNLCTPGTEVLINGVQPRDHCINSTSKTFRGEEWVRAEVMVLKDSVIKHIVNGDTVLTYSRPSIGGGVVSGYDPVMKKDGQPLESGYISLQGESHPIEFRKVEIMELGQR